MAEEENAQPAALGVVLVTDAAETIGAVLHCLRSQTARNRLELVVVGPLDDETFHEEEFARSSIVRIPELTSLEEARAAGVRAVTAPVVFLGETHSFPAPDFVQKLIEAHAGPWGAVQPAMENANRAGLIALSNLILDYGRWLAPGPAREVETVPDYNCSFKRDALLEGTRPLEELFQARSAVAEDLRGRGYRLYLEPAARLAHLNVATLGSWFPERYLAGRILGGARATAWPLRRRLLYVAGSLAIPAVIFARAWRVTPRLGLTWAHRLALAAPLLVGSLAWAVGEVVGYACGSGGAPRRMIRYELHKEAFSSGIEGHAVVPPPDAARSR